MKRVIEIHNIILTLFLSTLICCCSDNDSSRSIEQYKLGNNTINELIEKLPQNSNLKAICDFQGIDNIWDTDDDVCSVQINEYDENNHLIKDIELLGIGNDGKWLTDDDQAKQTEFIYENGLKVKEIFYEKMSDTTDGYSIDSSIKYYEIFSYDADQKQIKRIRFYDKGNDNTWFTEDDSINLIHTFAYDINNKKIYTYSWGIGPDNIWLTNDDMINYYTQYTYNTIYEIETSMISYFVGEDGEMLTSDDKMDEYSTLYEYSDASNTYKISEDGFYSDDSDKYRSSYQSETYNENGQLITSYRSYNTKTARYGESETTINYEYNDDNTIAKTITTDKDKLGELNSIAIYSYEFLPDNSYKITIKNENYEIASYEIFVYKQ